MASVYRSDAGTERWAFDFIIKGWVGRGVCGAVGALGAWIVDGPGGFTGAGRIVYGARGADYGTCDILCTERPRLAIGARA